LLLSKRFHLESSVRAYQIDRKYLEEDYKNKVSKLEIVRKKKFSDLLKGLPLDKQNEIKGFYGHLCDYVHLSEKIQMDALSDFSLNLALVHPYYEEDAKIFKNVLDLSKYLLIKSFSESSGC
jgi:hypothetical protein